MPLVTFFPCDLGFLYKKLPALLRSCINSAMHACRYLMVSGDEEVKLLLEAFQMSVSSCLSHPQTPVLRAQMLGRLMAVELSRSVKVQCPVYSPADAPASTVICELLC